MNDKINKTETQEEAAARRERIVGRIKKSMATAVDPGASETERETAARQAAKLRSLYAVQEWELAGGTPGAIKIGFAVARHMGKSFDFAPFAGFIAMGVAEYMGCIAEVTVRVDKNNGVQTGFKYCGEIQDVKFAVWLCETLCGNAYRAVKEAGIQNGNRGPWLNAYGIAIQFRLYEMARIQMEEENLSTGTALVVIDAKKAKIAEKFGEQKKGEAHRYETDTAGYIAGMEANIPVNRPIEKEADKKALGQ